MNILFLHRDIPGQFKHIITELLKNPENQVWFITDNNTIQLPGVKKFVYTPQQKVPDNCHPYLRNYMEALIHGQAAATVAMNMKKEGLIPDLIYGFSGWGNAMFMKDVFPEVPFLSYYEWYYHSDSAEIEYTLSLIHI